MSFLDNLLQKKIDIPDFSDIKTSLADESSNRAKKAMQGSKLLTDLKDAVTDNIAKIGENLLKSKLMGSAAGSIDSLTSSLDNQNNILGKLNRSILEGNVSTNDQNLIDECSACDVTGRLSAGILSDLIFPPNKKDYASGKSGVTSGFGSFGQPKDTSVWWDALGPGDGVMDGVHDDIIVDKVQPKLKHAYHGEFPDKLNRLDWLIKTMDRPKVDVESIEQMRNNVKRNYPVKYSFGDVSITFWDDVKHETVTSIESYFHKSVWTHKDISKTGCFQLRDSTVIPKFKIFDYVMESKVPLTYTFYNAILSSFDFDGHDDTDDGVHTVQVVLKIEGFTVTKGKV